MSQRTAFRGLKEPVVSCKLGTQPALVNVHGSDARKISPGNWIRVREWANQPWFQVYVHEVQPGGYFKADR